MKKVNAVIIEDEVPAARLLELMVRTLRPDWNVVAVSGEIDEAVSWFDSHPHPELIFLDVHLTDGDAFEFLSTVKPDSAIIFTTAYDQYAIRAFSFNSIAYILKPVDEARLSAAIEKFEKINDAEPDSSSSLEVILEALRNPSQQFRNRFVVRKGDDLEILSVDAVAYFYSESKVTYAVTASGKECCLDVPLSRLEEQLNPEMFFRVNRRFILNIDSIVKATVCSNGRIQVKVNPPHRCDILVSEGRCPAFRIWLNY
ncbi:MAG: LytR/AlgR family response regulator transcription factor [Candidatus Cryptobacteroides sp.]